jgi:hypothetical protein
LKRLKDFETERIKLFEKIKSLEDALKESQIPPKSSSNSELSVDIVNSLSHATIDSRIMFVKPNMSNNQTHKMCRDKGKNIDVHDHEKFESRNSKSRFIPTCHHCGIVSHTRPNYFQIRSQKPWVKKLVPRKDELGFENQVRALSEQVQIVSEKLGTLTFDKRIYAMISNKENPKEKQV